MRNRLHPDLLRAVALGLVFVVGVVVLAAASAIGQPGSLTPASVPGLAVTGSAAPRAITVRAAAVGAPVSVITTSQAFGY